MNELYTQLLDNPQLNRKFIGEGEESLKGKITEKKLFLT